jgi:hypothetical protein
MMDRKNPKSEKPCITTDTVCDEARIVVLEAFYENDNYEHQRLQHLLFINIANS